MTTIPQDIIAAARGSQAKWGVPASVSIAQWAIESGYGVHMPPGSNNPFGIKARPGQPAVEALTREESHGRSVHVMQPFRKFASLGDAFDLHGQLLHDGRPYRHAMALAANPDAFATALTGVYATDSHYGHSLIALMKALNLYQYNQPAKTA
jgi:flagellum-specific peptidoglycan hydrolase FlgJ